MEKNAIKQGEFNGYFEVKINRKSIKSQKYILRKDRKIIIKKETNGK